MATAGASGSPPYPGESTALGMVAAAASVALATALIYPLRQIAPPVSAGVIYLLGVLVVSIYWGLWLGVATSVLSALAFNFFHIPPEGTLDIAKGENWVALAVFLIVAVVVSSLAEQSRSRAREAERLRDAAIESHALRRSDELKTALLRAVSHDLRSPLTAIVAAGDALASARIEDADRRALAVVVAEEARRLSTLVDKLLDLSRLEAGQAQPRAEWCSLEEVVGTAVEETGGRERVTVALQPELPLLRVDAAQLERVMANLLENALRFSGSGPVEVRGEAVERQIFVRVIDSGPGIPERDLESVFQPFHRGSGERHGQGSGLGLAIVRGLVEVNGGRVRAVPGPVRGTEFVVELPIERQPERVPSGGAP